LQQVRKLVEYSTCENSHITKSGQKFEIQFIIT